MPISRWGPTFDQGIGNIIVDQIEKLIATVAPFARSAPRTVTGSVTLTIRDRFIIANMTGGAVTVTLPAVNDAMIARGHEITIKRSGASNTLTIQRSGSDTIDGATSLSPTRDKTSVRFVAATGGWLVEACYSTITTL